MNAIVQVELYLPPPITPAQAAAIIGRLGGQARSHNERERYRAKARELREQCGQEPDPRLAG